MLLCKERVSTDARLGGEANSGPPIVPLTCGFSGGRYWV